MPGIPISRGYRVVLSPLHRLPSRRRVHRTRVPLYIPIPAVATSSNQTGPLLPRGVLTDVLRPYRRVYNRPLDPTLREALLSEETAARVDVMDEWRCAYNELWRRFRVSFCVVFHRDTGVYLPLCYRIPPSNLYQFLREHHAADRTQPKKALK